MPPRSRSRWTAARCRPSRRALRRRRRHPAHAPPTQGQYQPSQPSPDELSKWNAPMVVSFRRKLAPYLAVNAILVPISLFSNHDFIALTVIWTVALAFKYSKLWAAGYDWRDVFRQPRDRLMFDVAAETIDDARALFDDKKRA